VTIAALIRTGELQPMRPWPRYLLSPEAWRILAQSSASGVDPAFLGLWADTAQVHALFIADVPLLASVSIEAGMFDALSPARPAAAPFERMVHDLWGHLPGNAVDPRPLLDQGRWPVLRPLSERPVPNAAPAEAREFLGAAGHDLHHVSVGSIGGGMDPVHLRITASGETVIRLEAGLGYAHRGILALMRGKSLRVAAALAARIAADCTVAHAVAFARAVEAATDVEPPPRGHALRGVMAELERIANHLADLGSAAPGRLAARCVDLREDVLRASHAAFGHRLMMDCVAPGGVSVDLAPAGMAALPAMLDRIAVAMPALRRSLHGMTGRITGVGAIGSKLIERSNARHGPGHAPYSRPGAAMPASRAGDVNARLQLRLTEISGSAALLREWLAGLPSGQVNVAVPAVSGEGLGVADGPRGDVWHWLRLDAGSVDTNFVRDPGWLQWPLIETACCGARLSDVPLILRSFNPSVAGLEL